VDFRSESLRSFSSSRREFFLFRIESSNLKVFRAVRMPPVLDPDTDPCPLAWRARPTSGSVTRSAGPRRLFWGDAGSGVSYPASTMVGVGEAVLIRLSSSVSVTDGASILPSVSSSTEVWRVDEHSL
jgi:hypothetical protein